MKTFKPEVIWAGETEWKPFSRWSYDDFQEVLESVEQSLENDRMYHGHIDKNQNLGWDR